MGHFVQKTSTNARQILVKMVVDAKIILEHLNVYAESSIMGFYARKLAGSYKAKKNIFLNNF